MSIDSAEGSQKSVWAENVNTSAKVPAFIGFAILVSFVGGFGFWASLAPLSGAAVASGVIAASGQNQVIQHFEGGIVEKILVREGENVTKGQSLLVLDKTAAEATKNRLSKLIISQKARITRLEAERDGQVKFEFQPELVEEAEAENQLGDLEEQMAEFLKRHARNTAEQGILTQRIAAMNEQIEGLKAQKKAAERQLEVVRGDLERKRKLLKRGLTQRSQVTLLERNEADLLGRIGSFVADLGRARTSIVEADEQKEKLRAEKAEKAVTDLNQVRRDIADAREQLYAAVAVLERIVIRAPSDGVIVSMKKNTPGSVVGAGEDILELLPTSSELIVDARVSPLDVDVIAVGQVANLRFSALNQRTTPEVQATVTYVSADRLIDPATQESYYTARLKIAEQLPASIDKSKIFPGMPVETYIKTGDRTFFEYVSRPILDSFNRAFREE